MWALSLGALHPPNSNWTGYIFTGYSPTLTLRWSCHGRRERRGGSYTPSSGRLCGKAQRRSTTFLTRYYYWPPCHSHFHQDEGSQMEEGMGFHPTLKCLQDINLARAKLECELAQETQGWLKDTMIGGSKWLESMRDVKHRWPRRQTSPFKRSFLRGAWLTQSSCCPGTYPVQFFFATWVKHWPPPQNRK